MSPTLYILHSGTALITFIYFRQPAATDLRPIFNFRRRRQSIIGITQAPRRDGIRIECAKVLKFFQVQSDKNLPCGAFIPHGRFCFLFPQRWFSIVDEGEVVEV